MGYPDPFAKQTFAEETERLTGGAMSWQDPPEIGLVKLVKVQGDGLLLVHRPDLLATLAPPWSEAQGYLQVLLEAKMAGDHLDEPAVERAVLRCLALRVQGLEGQEPPWPPAAPLWCEERHVARARAEAAGADAEASTVRRGADAHPPRACERAPHAVPLRYPS